MVRIRQTVHLSPESDSDSDSVEARQRASVRSLFPSLRTSDQQATPPSITSVQRNEIEPSRNDSFLASVEQNNPEIAEEVRDDDDEEAEMRRIRVLRNLRKNCVAPQMHASPTPKKDGADKFIPTSEGPVSGIESSASHKVMGTTVPKETEDYRCPVPAEFTAPGRNEVQSSTANAEDVNEGMNTSTNVKLFPKIMDSHGLEDDDDDDIVIGPAPPPASNGQFYSIKKKTVSLSRPTIDPKIIDDSESESDSGRERPEGDGFDDEDGHLARIAEALQLPVSHEAVFGTTHSAQICGLSLDPSGSRVASAGADSIVRLWDFNAMDNRMLCLRESEPMKGTTVASARFSDTGSKILCAGGLPVARVLDREGNPVLETVPGDMYIVDMSRTKGHVSELRDARWLSRDASCFATVGGDGTLRFWDVMTATAPASVFDGDLPRAKLLNVVKLRNSRGMKTCATAMVPMGNISGPPDRTVVALGCEDATIKIIDPDVPSYRPAMEVSRAVSDGALITALECPLPSASCPASLMLVRSTDDALRVYDLRKQSAALATFHNLPNVVPQTGVCFVGMGSEFFAAGTSANRRNKSDCASIELFETATLRKVWKTTISSELGSVVAITWHPRLNQFFYGCANGSIHAMYDPEISQNGVLRCIGKMEPRRAHGVASISVGEIYSPHDASRIRKFNGAVAERTGRKRARQMASKSSIDRIGPEIADEPKVASSFTKSFMQSKVKKTWADEDPRDALLKLDEVTRRAPVFTSAYTTTQPVPLYTDKTMEEEEEQARLEMLARNKHAAARNGSRSNGHEY